MLPIFRYQIYTLILIFFLYKILKVHTLWFRKKNLSYKDIRSIKTWFHHQGMDHLLLNKKKLFISVNAERNIWVFQLFMCMAALSIASNWVLILKLNSGRSNKLKNSLKKRFIWVKEFKTQKSCLLKEVEMEGKTIESKKTKKRKRAQQIKWEYNKFLRSTYKQESKMDNLQLFFLSWLNMWKENGDKTHKRKQ